MYWAGGHASCNARFCLFPVMSQPAHPHRVVRHRPVPTNSVSLCQSPRACCLALRRHVLGLCHRLVFSVQPGSHETRGNFPPGGNLTRCGALLVLGVTPSGGGEGCSPHLVGGGELFRCAPPRASLRREAPGVGGTCSRLLSLPGSDFLPGGCPHGSAGTELGLAPGRHQGPVLLGTPVSSAHFLPRCSL